MNNLKCPLKRLLAVMALLALPLVSATAQLDAENQTPESELPKATVREVFVPNAEMATLLENCKDRVLLSRDELESLLIESLTQKESEPESESPVAAVFLSSDLAIVIEGEQAKIKAVLEWESLTDKLIAEPLPFDAVTIQSATLNGQPARLGSTSMMIRSVDNDGNDTNRFDPAEPRYTLFWQGKGRQRLELELTTALTVDSVRQELAFAVPRAPKATETLVVSGDVELKSGAMIVSRHVEGEGLDRRTRFELLTDDVRQHLVLTLNSHRTRMLRSVLAKSVQFAEVTEHYEKLHATFSLDVLHQPVSKAEFVVPPTFEMTEVNSPQLARWELVERDGQSVLVVHFREPVGGQVPLNLTAVHFFETDSTAETLAEWAFPMFEPLEVNANTAVFGLLLDAGWNAHTIDADRLIAIAPQILNRTIPDSVFEASVDAPAVRTVAAWYAPNTDGFRITCEFLKPKPVFDVVSHQVLTLNDREQTLRGLMQIAPRYEKLFALQFDVPQNWTVTRVTNESDAPLPFEQKGDRVRVKVTSGIVPGTIFPVFFEASGNTPGWFGEWDTQALPFPGFRLVDAADDRGTIAVDVDEDMIVTSENDVRLVPLDSKERTEFLAGVPTDLAFRYLSQPYSTELKVARATPRLTARSYAFFGFAPSLMSARYELHYTVEQAKAKSLAFLLPTETPDRITIRGLNVAVKDYADSTVTVDNRQYRKWDVQLTDPQAGLLMLAVDFEQATPEETTQSLPLATACDVAWQTGLVSVEGHEELNLTLPENVESRNIRQVDVGELAATQYIPGKRLLGVFEGLAGAKTLEVAVTRNPDFQLPVSLVQLARVDVEIAAGGKRVTRAIYDLKTRATFLKIDLAENEEIWAVSLDGQTIKPQKSGSAIMVDIPARDDAAIRELEVVWAAKESGRSAPLFASSAVRLPDLMIPQNVAGDQNAKNDQAAQNAVAWRKIPVTRIAWNVTAPPGYEVTRIGNRRIETETPRPIVLQYLSKLFASSDTPRERRGFGCNGVMAKRSATILQESAASSADFSEDMASDMAFESERYGKVPSSMQNGADFGELAELVQETIDPNSWRDESDKKMDAFADSAARDAPAGELAVERGVRRQNVLSDRAPEREMSDERRDGKLLEFSPNASISPSSSSGGRITVERGDAVPYQRQTLQTVRPVQVQFQQNLSSDLQRHVQLQLVGGSESQLKVRMVNTRVVTVGMYLVWGGILCAGLCLLKASRRVRTIYVLAVLSLGTLLVLVPRLEMFAGLFDAAVKAGFWVFVIYILVGGYRMCKHYRSSVSTAALVLLAFAAMCGSLHADDASNDVAAKAITLPDDAIVAFYDAESLSAAPLLENGMPDPKALTQPNQKLLVPYAKYVELWNLVHPEAKVEPEDKPPVEYVATFGEYRAALGTSDELSIVGKLEIESLTDEPVLFPLPVTGGILTSLKVDGKDAEISIGPQVMPLPANDQPTQQQVDPQQVVLPVPMRPNADDRQQMQQQSIMPPPVHGGVFVLQLRGKGKHVIELTVKYKVDRQGGWRLAAGRLPEFPAGKVLLELPEDRMELRCNDVYAQQKWQAQAAGETVETSLGRSGQFRWSWRSKVTEAEIDQSLTADSELRFNVQEDALVLEWDLTLAFRRGKHESFRVRIPADYLVVSIDGENVRGWENAESDAPDEALVDVELLHAAQEVERFNIVLMRRADFAEAENVAVTTPNVGVIGAAMHHGRVTLRNSPRLDVKTGELLNASMTDLPDSPNTGANSTANANTTARNAVSDNPLGIKSYRAYRFTTENYRLPLAVSIVRERPNCIMQSIVKLATHEVRLETKYALYLTDKTGDSFSERLILPVGLQLENVQSELPIEWSTKPLESGETELTVIWSLITNRRVEFNMLGTITRESEETIDMPIIVPTGRELVSKEIVVQTDPAFDVGLHELTNCHERPDSTTPGWVVASQRSLCRKWLLCNLVPNDETAVKPSAKLSLIPREPVITSESITNVQVNSRSVDETILLDFNIQNAGVRSVRFELPKSMADAKIDAPLLQRKEIADDENGDAITVTLWLQDEIMNEFRVLIRNNRELVAGKTYAVSIPKIATGTVLNQYVVLENAGSFDELQVDATSLRGMRRISRQNKEWADLAAILGGGATEAYLAVDQAKPQLAFNMVRRETFKMSGARIGLAETRVVLDENGDYLAEQIYHIDNKTEQFLDLKLPPGAGLWAVRLLTNQEWEAKQSGAAGDFGQPVKPTLLPEDVATAKKIEAESGVRIPIIKTEVGDLDYVVRIVYAGKCKPVRWTSKLDIPFIEVLNIPVGASYARLHLPENYKYKFDGTMSESDQSAIAKTNSEYEKQVIAKLEQAAQTGNPYEQARAISNLTLKQGDMQSRSYEINRPTYATQVEQAPTFGGYQASGQIAGLMEPGGVPIISPLSNSDQLEQRFESQSNYRGTNVVAQSESNWKVDQSKVVSGSMDMSGQLDQSDRQFNTEWLGKNNLENPMNKEAKGKDALPEVREEARSRSSQSQSDSPFGFEMGLMADGRFDSDMDDADFEPASKAEGRQLPRVSVENRQQSAQSLKSQERLNDSDMASRLSGNRLVANGEMAQQGMSGFVGGAPAGSGFVGSTSDRQQPQSVDNLALYQQRLAVQNAPARPATPNQPVPQTRAPQESARPAPPAVTSPAQMAGSMGMLGNDGESYGGGFGGGSGMAASGPGGSGAYGGGRTADSSSPVPAESRPDAMRAMVIDGAISSREPSLMSSAQPGMSPLMEPMDVNGTLMFDSPVMTTTMAAKAASLDIEIPQTGTVYFFTAPQAENRLSVSGVSTTGSQRTKDFAYVLGLIAVCGTVGFFIVRRNRPRQAA